MSAEPVGRFTFPAENDDFDDNIEERLANRLRENRPVEKQPFMDDFSDRPRANQSQSFEQTKAYNPQKAVSNTNIFNPSTYDDAQQIAEEILSGNSAIVNLEHLLSDEKRQQEAIRIVDFLCGVAYAIKIDVKRVNAATFLFTLK